MATGPGQLARRKEEKVSARSLNNAEKFIQKGNYGRAFAHYLLVLKLTPNKKTDIKENFTLALREWGEQLEKSGRVQDLFKCYEQACELFPECETMLNNMGAQLFRLGYIDEAACFFRRSIKLDPDYLGARENLENICGHLVERWHFRMLNDRIRNEAYRGAIASAIRDGFDSVLDIGTGTGLLSMFAAEAGARAVYACDMSKTMYEMSCDVIHTNQMSQKINLIHSKSSDLQIPDDIPERVSLVVTEIFDVALLGEGALPSLEHAWKNLLKSPGYARVIPGAATMFVCAIESDYIREHNRFLYPGMQNLDFQGIRLECKTSHNDLHQSYEPYTSERLDMVPGGCKVLTQPIPFAQLNFNDPECIGKYLKGFSQGLSLPVSANGRVDAIATWFDLHLDSEVTLSTAPGSGSCWEQTLFPILPSQLSNDDTHNLLVRQNDKIELCCAFAADYLKFKCKSIQKAPSTPKVTLPSSLSVINQSTTNLTTNAIIVNGHNPFTNGNDANTVNFVNGNMGQQQPLHHQSFLNEYLLSPMFSRHRHGQRPNRLQNRPQTLLQFPPPSSILNFGATRLASHPLSAVPPTYSTAMAQLHFGDLEVREYLNSRPADRYNPYFGSSSHHFTNTDADVTYMDDTSSSDDASVFESQHSSNNYLTEISSPSNHARFNSGSFPQYTSIPPSQILYQPKDFEVSPPIDNEDNGNESETSSSDSIFFETFHLNRNEVWKLNDLDYNRSLCGAMNYLKSNLGEYKLLTFCDNVPIMALQALQLGASEVCLVNSSEHEPFLFSVAANNGIVNNRLRFISNEDIETLEGDFEALVVELIDEGGCLQQRVLEDIALARATCLESSAVIVPGRVTVQAMLIESYALRQDSMVTSDDNTLGFLIAGFMNDFQMTTHCGIDLSVLEHEPLSQPFELLTFDLNEFNVGEVPSYLELSNTINVRATETGTIHAILYWFDLHLTPEIKVSSLDTRFHFKQAAIIQKIPITVSTGSTLRVKSMCRNNCIHANLSLAYD